MYSDSDDTLDKFSAQIGELAQHHLTHDDSVLETSMWYYDMLDVVLKKYFDTERHDANPRYMEVACYRHIIGYKLAKERSFESTLFDISDRDLELGRQYAEEAGYTGAVERVAGDFHSLPFNDGYFDVSFVSASIHHTLTPEILIGEMMRVLKDGGLFYCQREPAERMFCFYQFNANRPQQYTTMEARLHERQTMRLFSSPFPGARNAEVFGRVENDRIPLDRYYEIFAEYGEVVDEVLYHDGLLTSLDKEILANSDLPEKELSAFIYEKVLIEAEIMEESMSLQDRLLGYSVPSRVAIAAMSRRVASALKARDSDECSINWQRQMVRIFGGSLRFVVRRGFKDKKALFGLLGKGSRVPAQATINKYSRSCTEVNSVYLDDAVYKNSGLQLWNKLLQDIQSSDKEHLFDESFIAGEWDYHDDVEKGCKELFSITSEPRLRLAPKTSSVVVIRYSLVLDDDLPAATLIVRRDDEIVAEQFVPQSEDRMLRILCDGSEEYLSFSLKDGAKKDVSSASRIHISILQSIPVHLDVDKVKQVAK